MSNTIIDWIVEQKLAKNNFAAAHIANGLQLYKIANDLTEQKKRVELYRKWRDATKDAPAKCYEYVLEGKEPPAELFASESLLAKDWDTPEEDEAWAYLAEKEAEIRKFRKENPDTQYVIKEVGVRKIINELGFEQYQ